MSCSQRTVTDLHCDQRIFLFNNQYHLSFDSQYDTATRVPGAKRDSFSQLALKGTGGPVAQRKANSEVRNQTDQPQSLTDGGLLYLSLLHALSLQDELCNA